jgi:hypothetical protein
VHGHTDEECSEKFRGAGTATPVLSGFRVARSGIVFFSSLSNTPTCKKLIKSRDFIFYAEGEVSAW